MIFKLGMQHRGLKLYKVYINDDPVLTLTYFTTWSHLVACAFERKTCYKIINWKTKLAANDQIWSSMNEPRIFPINLE